jgi:hypothetical protein
MRSASRSVRGHASAWAAIGSRPFASSSTSRASGTEPPTAYAGRSIGDSRRRMLAGCSSIAQALRLGRRTRRSTPTPTRWPLAPRRRPSSRRAQVYDVTRPLPRLRAQESLLEGEAGAGREVLGANRGPAGAVRAATSARNRDARAPHGAERRAEHRHDLFIRSADQPRAVDELRSVDSGVRRSAAVAKPRRSA